MKNRIAALIEQALQQLELAPPARGIVVERTRDERHGNFASNIALMLAKPAGRNPRALAEEIIAALPENEAITKTEIAGPGFINFFIAADVSYAVIDRILNEAEKFGRSTLGAEQKIHIEYVSANPTGPLHVGHGRGAAYGASLANVLMAAGYDVHREYYVNDAGRQMDILAVSVWLRYLEALGEPINFPVAGYKSEGYIRDIAAELKTTHGKQLQHSWAEISKDLPADEQLDSEQSSGDKEAHIDALISRARELLGEADYETVFQAGLVSIRDEICDDLLEFGVEYDRWYSERSLSDNDAIVKAVAQLEAAGHTYSQDGALWFKSTSFGDDKDRVIIRDNGQSTYFASDIAYHLEKCARGFDLLVDVWGSDHHGYIPRVKAAMSALGQDAKKLDVQLVQFAILYRGAEKVPMSTRAGKFVTLRDLRKEVGNDAARFFYVLRSADQHLDFDLELAKSQSNENPVYYVQYAHARVSSVLRQLAERDVEYDASQAKLDLLSEAHEKELLTQLDRYPEMLELAAKQRAPHHLAHYLRELAQAFHSYYNSHQFLVDDAALRNARLKLILATQQVIKNALALLGVSAPEEM